MTTLDQWCGTPGETDPRARVGSTGRWDGRPSSAGSTRVVRRRPCRSHAALAPGVMVRADVPFVRARSIAGCGAAPPRVPLSLERAATDSSHARATRRAPDPRLPLNGRDQARDATQSSVFDTPMASFGPSGRDVQEPPGPHSTRSASCPSSSSKAWSCSQTTEGLDAFGSDTHRSERVVVVTARSTFGQEHDEHRDGQSEHERASDDDRRVRARRHHGASASPLARVNRRPIHSTPPIPFLAVLIPFERTRLRWRGMQPSSFASSPASIACGLAESAGRSRYERDVPPVTPDKMDVLRSRRPGGASQQRIPVAARGRDPREASATLALH